LEIDPIIGSIIEIGNKVDVKTTNLKMEYENIKNKAENLGLYKRSKLIDQVTS
jgi:ketopantoate reductase